MVLCPSCPSGMPPTSPSIDRTVLWRLWAQGCHWGGDQARGGLHSVFLPEQEPQVCTDPSPNSHLGAPNTHMPAAVNFPRPLGNASPAALLLPLGTPSHWAQAPPLLRALSTCPLLASPSSTVVSLLLSAQKPCFSQTLLRPDVVNPPRKTLGLPGDLCHLGP